VVGFFVTDAYEGFILSAIPAANKLPIAAPFSPHI
jgi:hypothetical protein